MIRELLFSDHALQLGYGIAAAVLMIPVVWALLHTLESLVSRSRRRALSGLDTLGRPRI